MPPAPKSVTTSIEISYNHSSRGSVEVVSITDLAFLSESSGNWWGLGHLFVSYSHRKNAPGQ